MSDKREEWLRVRKSWLSLNPPTHEGHFLCGICGKTVHKDDMELDHILPRSGTAKALSSDFANLQPSHYRCNRLKGSKRLKPLVSDSEYKFRKLLDL